MHFFTLKHKLNNRGFSHVVLPIILVIGIGSVGTYTLLRVNAATASKVRTGELSTYLENGSGKVMCLDDYKNLSANDNPVNVYPCSTTDPGQKWTLYNNNTITIHGKCLDVNKNLKSNGSKIDIFSCNGGANQSWKVGTNPALSLNDLVSSASGKCLDDSKAFTANNNPTDLYSCNGNDNQVWGWNTNGKIVEGGTTADANCNHIGAVEDGGACYAWVGASQNDNNKFTSTGVSANFSQGDPKCSSACIHSLVELMASSSDNKNTIEYGWGVQSGASKPTLGIGLWANGNPINADANFVQVSKTVKINQTLSVGAIANYKILFTNNQWQLSYNNTEVGYFPESIWTSRSTSFTQLGWIEVFGEVAQQYAAAAKMQMGDGILGSLSGSTTVSNYSLYGSSTPAELVNFFIDANPAYFNDGGTSSSGFSYGGPGV